MLCLHVGAASPRLALHTQHSRRVRAHAHRHYMMSNNTRLMPGTSHTKPAFDTEKENALRQAW